MRLTIGKVLIQEVIQLAVVYMFSHAHTPIVFCIKTKKKENSSGEVMKKGKTTVYSLHTHTTKGTNSNRSCSVGLIKTHRCQSDTGQTNHAVAIVDGEDSIQVLHGDDHDGSAAGSIVAGDGTTGEAGVLALRQDDTVSLHDALHGLHHVVQGAGGDDAQGRWVGVGSGVRGPITAVRIPLPMLSATQAHGPSAPEVAGVGGIHSGRIHHVLWAHNLPQPVGQIALLFRQEERRRRRFFVPLSFAARTGETIGKDTLIARLLMLRRRCRVPTGSKPNRDRTSDDSNGGGKFCVWRRRR
jgi:hypothetical protein